METWQRTSISIDMDSKGPAEERGSANLRGGWGEQGHPNALRSLCVTRHTLRVVGHTLEIGRGHNQFHNTLWGVTMLTERKPVDAQTTLESL